MPEVQPLAVLLAGCEEYVLPNAAQPPLTVVVLFAEQLAFVPAGEPPPLQLHFHCVEVSDASAYVPDVQPFAELLAGCEAYVPPNAAQPPLTVGSGAQFIAEQLAFPAVPEPWQVQTQFPPERVAVDANPFAHIMAALVGAVAYSWPFAVPH